MRDSDLIMHKTATKVNSFLHFFQTVKQVYEIPVEFYCYILQYFSFFLFYISDFTQYWLTFFSQGVNIILVYYFKPKEMFQVANSEFSELFKSCMPLFIALGDEVRLTIIEVLASTDSFHTNVRGMNVNEITIQTSLSRPAISHHLKILKEAGLVSVRQEGTANFYFLTFGESTRKLCTLGQYLQNFMDPVQ